jgi:hypothetical protein
MERPLGMSVRDTLAVVATSRPIGTGKQSFSDRQIQTGYDQRCRRRADDRSY